MPRSAVPFEFQFFQRSCVSCSSQRVSSREEEQAMSDIDDRCSSVTSPTGVIKFTTLPNGHSEIIEHWRVTVKEHHVPNRRQQFLLLTQMTFASQTQEEKEKSLTIGLLSLCLLSEFPLC